MAEMLMDGIGSANFAIVDDNHRLYTTGSITSMPAITSTAGSQSHLFASGVAFHELIATPEDALITSVSGGVHIAGSIMIGSVSAIVESVYIQSGDNIAITSLPAAMGSVGVTALPGDLGSVVISSSTRLGVSGGIFIDGKLTGSFAPKGIGSVVIHGAPLLGVSGAIFDSGDITGSIVISSSNKLGISGIVDVATMPTVTVDASDLDIRDLTSVSDSVEIVGTGEIGSVVISSAPLIGVSGTIFDSGDITGSIVLADTSSRLGVSGTVDVGNTVTVDASDLDIRSLTSASDSVEITGTSEIGSVVISSAPLIGVSGLIFTDGKMTGSMAMKGIGSVIISSSNLVGVSGAIFDSGDITGSVVISSSSLVGVSGLIFTDGKMTGSMSMQGVGSVIIQSSNLIGISGAIFDSGDITGSVVISSSTRLGVSGAIDINDVTTIGSFTNQSVTVPTDEFIQRLDYSGAMNVPIYMGLAAPGTAVDTAGWQLKQLSYHTNSMVSGILFGSGNTNFDKKWSDRADENAEYS